MSVSLVTLFRFASTSSIYYGESLGVSEFQSFQSFTLKLSWPGRSEGANDKVKCVQRLTATHTPSLEKKMK